MSGVRGLIPPTTLLVGLIYLGLASPSPVYADDPVSSVDDHEAADPMTERRWSVGVIGHVGGLEHYPLGGLSIEVLHQRRPRLRIGPRLTYWVPRRYGNVRRQVMGLDLSVSVDVIQTTYVKLLFDTSLSLGVFHDDYVQVYPDVHRISPGFSLGASVEVRATDRIAPFLGFRGVFYFANDVVDNQWLETTLGLRIRL